MRNEERKGVREIGKKREISLSFWGDSCRPAQRWEGLGDPTRARRMFRRRACSREFFRMVFPRLVQEKSFCEGRSP